MSSWLRWLALCVFVTLFTMVPAFAATEPAAPAGQLELAAPAPQSAETPIGQLQPVRLVKAPSYTLTTPTLLAAGSQPFGQVTRQAGTRGQRAIQWALIGAAIGLAWGLIDDDPVEKALIGGVVGFGLSYIVRY